MPLFTRCNIGLRCPQNVFVKFQLKIPHKNVIFGACLKMSCFGVYHLELHIPDLPLDEAVLPMIPMAVSTQKG